MNADAAVHAEYTFGNIRNAEAYIGREQPQSGIPRITLVGEYLLQRRTADRVNPTKHAGCCTLHPKNKNTQKRGMLDSMQTGASMEPGLTGAGQKGQQCMRGWV